MKYYNGNISYFVHFKFVILIFLISILLISANIVYCIFNLILNIQLIYNNLSYNNNNI